MAYLIVKFWALAAAGWVLFIGTTYLWRRAAERVQEQKNLRRMAIKLLRDDLERAKERSLEKWLEDEMPEGLTVYYITGGVPVVAEGKVEGFEFFFRARGNRWQFHVAYEDDPSYTRGALWRREGWYGTARFAASWMPHADALALVLDCAARFRDELPASTAPRLPGL